MPSTEPYKFTFEGGEDNSYFFISHRDVVYQVKFKPSFYLFDAPAEVAENVFELVIADIYVPRQQPPLLDLQTPVTIAAIVEDFLQKRERVAVYVLADADGRAYARQRKFDHWFRHFNSAGYAKHDQTFGNPEGPRYHTSMIYRLDNPLKFDFLEAFDRLAETYNADK